MALNVFLRTLLIYFLVLFLIRIMGKREVGQLSAFDLVVAIMIAELAVFPMEQTHIPLYIALIPMFTLGLMEILISYLCLKNRIIRYAVSGSPTVIISNGKILENEMRHLRYNINDLLGQLREKGVPNIDDVEFAILETSGDLSVILKSEKKALTPEDLNLPTKRSILPLPLILDGEIHQENLALLNIDENWLKKQLKLNYNINKASDVFFASIDGNSKLYVSKKSKKENL